VEKAQYLRLFILNGGKTLNIGSDNRTPLAYEDLLKRASELRDILGLAKCSALLSRVLTQQSKDQEDDRPKDNESHPRPRMERTPSTLRPEANEWTPPNGTESPRTILKRVLRIGTDGDTPTPTAAPSLLPPFVEYPPAAGIFYVPVDQTTKSDTLQDLTGDGKQFISSLAAKADIGTPLASQQPVGHPSKRSVPPPGLTLPAAQKPHSFPLVTSLLPQTFSVHLLSTLHIRLQHVSAALEMLDSSFASEITKTATTQAPNSTRWDNWMSPTGAAGMNKALLELRRSLDELCGATARAGWIVDTWGAYQEGMIGGSRGPEPGLGSSAINGVEIGLEAGLRSGLQAPIGRPSMEKPKKASQQQETEMGEGSSHSTAASMLNGKGGHPSTGSGTLRPPPGLAFPLKTTTNGGDQTPELSVNGSKYFPMMPVVSNGIQIEKLNFQDKPQDKPQDKIALMKHHQHGAVSVAAPLKV
jgi:hypothetical protein